MLIRFWERLRGYEKWAPAIATVQSTTLSPIAEIANDRSKPPVALGSESVCTIRWSDQHQLEHTAVFRAFEESPLYQLCDGDTVEIRFNPQNPSEYYLPGLIQSEIARAWKLTVYIMMIIVLGIAFLIFLLAH